MNRSIWLVALSAVLWAQPQPEEKEIEPPGRVARLSFLDGNVSFQAASTADWAPAQTNRPLTNGDRLYTEPRSRAELNTGTAAYRIAPATGVNVDQLDDSFTRIIITDGAVHFRVKQLEDNESIEIDTPNGTVQVNRPGEYRVNVFGPDRSEAIVYVGELRVNGTNLGPRRSATMTGQDGRLDFGVSMPPRDNFDQWSESRDRLADRSESARYVSPGTIGYEDLDANGEWIDAPDYGRVWRPRAVAADWAPYRYGHWAWVSPWGWTWVDDASWGFAPFHYGRWAYYSNSWCWVPGPRAVRAVYAPALVSFHIGGLSVGIGVAPVRWVPLGPGEVWAPGFRATPRYWERANVNNTTIVNKTVINNYYTNVRTNNVENINRNTYVNQNAPRAVSAVSRETFSNARPVHRGMVDGGLPAASPRSSAPVPAVANDGRVVGRQDRQQQQQQQQQQRQQQQAQAPVVQPRQEIRNTPDPTRAARSGSVERSTQRPPEHISREDVRPKHVETKDNRPGRGERKQDR